MKKALIKTAKKHYYGKELKKMKKAIKKLSKKELRALYVLFAQIEYEKDRLFTEPDDGNVGMK